jgi:glutamate N-acetyltransferase/amino-acid N-acetyltransferase
MINPNMATMLGYFLSDIKIDKELAQKIIKKTSDNSFNMISVDGDMSTNDCVFMLANGASNVDIANEDDLDIFVTAMQEISIVLAKSIARDGEGATKLIEAQAIGLADLDIAKDIAKKIISSSLVKTAVYGESPNWGRILAKIGEANITEDALDNCEIFIQGHKVFANGLPAKLNTEDLKKTMKEDTVSITVKFDDGEHNAMAWGCDLTQQYVSINADYLS